MLLYLGVTRVFSALVAQNHRHECSRETTNRHHDQFVSFLTLPFVYLLAFIRFSCLITNCNGILYNIVLTSVATPFFVLTCFQGVALLSLQLLVVFLDAFFYVEVRAVSKEVEDCFSELPLAHPDHE